MIQHEKSHVLLNVSLASCIRKKNICIDKDYVLYSNYRNRFIGCIDSKEYIIYAAMRQVLCLHKYLVNAARVEAGMATDLITHNPFKEIQVRNSGFSPDNFSRLILVQAKSR